MMGRENGELLKELDSDARMNLPLGGNNLFIKDGIKFNKRHLRHA